MSDEKSSDQPKGLSTKQNMLWNSAGSLAYLGCQWLITIFVVRLSTGYDAAGVLSLAMTIYNTFSPLAIYRMYTYQVSDVSRENTTGEYFAFRIITCSLAITIGITYSFLTCSQEALGAIAMYFLFKASGLLIDVLHGVDQLNSRMDYIGKSLAMQGIGTLATFCGSFYATQNLELSIAGMTVVTIIIGILYDTPRTAQFEKIRISISKPKAIHLLLYCFPIVIATIACSAATSIPRQYLAILEGEASLGIYASIAAPIAIIQMGASYIYNPLLSTFSKKYASGEYKSFWKLFAKTSLGIATLGLVCTLALELFGPWVLTLMFGESIAPYTYLLTPAIICAMAAAYVWFLNDLLVAFRIFKGSVIGNIATLAVSIPSTFFFINLWDMNGVSFTGIASYGSAAIIMAAILIFNTRKRAAL